MASNVTLQSLILGAFKLQSYELIGGPDWVRIERFDVSATGSPKMSIEETRTNVQSLLNRVFKLKMEKERRETITYSLKTVRQDKSVGPRLRPSVSCGDRLKNGFLSLSGGLGLARTSPDGLSRIGICSDLLGLVNTLSQLLELRIVDETALQGVWDYELTLPKRNLKGASGRISSDTVAAMRITLETNLGLRLESHTETMDLVVIKDVQRPS